MFVKDRLYAALNLNDKELSLYDSVARILERNVIAPDLVIFLQSDTDRLMQNIKALLQLYWIIELQQVVYIKIYVVVRQYLW